MKIKICPQCNTENRKEANFCKECKLNLTSVMAKTVRRAGEKKFPALKIVSGIVIAGLFCIFVWYLFTNIMVDKAKKAVREMIKVEKEINSLDNEMVRRYSLNEINKAKEFLKEAKKASERNDHAGAVEWLNQAREMINTSKEKEKTGRQKDYNSCMEKGNIFAEQGRWDEAIETYEKAFKYKPDDKKAENEIKFVETKKEEEIGKEQEEQRQREAEAKKREEQGKQKIADYISKGKRYMSQKKYLEAVDEFQKAMNLGASGEVTRLLAEAKKKEKKKYEVQKDEWKIIDDDLVIMGAGGGKYLMWLRDSNGVGCNNGRKLEWKSAMSWAQDLVYKGCDDWCLPTKDELKQLYDHGRTYITYSSKGYWSSSESAPGKIYPWRYAWYVNFSNGVVGYSYKTNVASVRPVRRGP